MNYLLDTNVISEPRRPHPNPRIVSWFQRTALDSLYISALTMGELTNGVSRLARHDPAQAEKLRRWLDATRLGYADRIVSVDLEIAETWGRLGALRPLPVVDGLLAATALVGGMTLVTRNVRDMADLNVSVLNPWE